MISSQGQAILDRVRNVFRTPILKKICFIVPGNHDVNRKEAPDSDNEWLVKRSLEEVQNTIAKGDKQWQRFMERLHAYRRISYTEAAMAICYLIPIVSFSQRGGILTGYR